MISNSDEHLAPESDESSGKPDDMPSEESTEIPNYTDRHPEHFRRPPGHVREFREDEEISDETED